jgi:MFS-type transporter involved in bile tolerance (Atg22 family)
LGRDRESNEGDPVTKSQIYSAIGAIATVILTIIAAVNPYLPLLPEKHKWIGTVIVIVGAVCTSLLTAFNQSLSPNHYSVPRKREAKKGKK